MINKIRGTRGILQTIVSTTPTNSVYGAMQDGYVERFDQKISPHPSFPKRGITISPFGPLLQRLRGEQRGNKGDFVNCRSSINSKQVCRTRTSLCPPLFLITLPILLSYEGSYVRNLEYIGFQRQFYLNQR